MIIMSITDIMVRHYLISVGGVILVGFFPVLWFAGSIKQRVFSYMMHKMTEKYNFASHEIKQDFFKPLNELVSKNIDLKKRGLIRVLEVGVGTGANLQYFPKNAVLTVLDVNPFMEKFYKLNMAKNPDIQYERFIVGSALDMHEIPDGSYDVVVCTLLMCSLPDNHKFIKEAHRILVSGGHFFFIEHCIEKPGTIVRRIQESLDWSGIWAFFGEGCHLTRDPSSLIQRVFGEAHITYYHLNTKLMPMGFMARLISHHFRGTATKT